MILVGKDEIQKCICTLRGVQVMLDKDLAKFYGIKPIRLREQIKRNPNRFPEDFVFQLNDQEVEILVSQNAIPSKQSLGGSLPLAFTEQGVAAVSGVVKNEKAALVSVALARAFVSMRHFFLNHTNIFLRLENIEWKQVKMDAQIEQIFTALQAGTPLPEKGIFFDGQIFDAYVFVSDLIKQAESDIILIDNYIDETVLILFSKRP